MESINERVHKLIEENRDKFNGEHVSFDGVVDEDAYLKSDVHVAFLLKDTD